MTNYHRKVIWPTWSFSMMTSSNGNIFHVTVLCAGNSPVTGEFPSQWPVKRSFEVSFDLRLNKQLNKQSRIRWFETPSRLSWPHCYAIPFSLVIYLFMGYRRVTARWTGYPLRIRNTIPTWHRIHLHTTPALQYWNYITIRVLLTASNLRVTASV